MTFQVADTILLTGATGFIAAHIVDQLFAAGYNVIGTVRTPEKGEYFVAKYPGFKYEIVNNLTNENAFDAVFKKYPEIKYVLHAASPVAGEDDDFVKSYINPAVEGTLSALKGAHKYGKNVKKIVLTSSVVAAFPKAFGPYDSSVLVSESTWNPITLADVEANPDWMTGYSASKTFAEKAFWEFQKKESPKFAFSTMIVPLVYGPPIHDATYENPSLSLGFFKSIIELPKDTKELPSEIIGDADVRDIARAHIVTLFNPKADNHRVLVISGERATAQSILDILHKFRPKEAAHLPVGTPGVENKDANFRHDNTASKKLLNFEFISRTKSTLDLFDALQFLKKKSLARK